MMMGGLGMAILVAALQYQSVVTDLGVLRIKFLYTPSFWRSSLPASNHDGAWKQGCRCSAGLKSLSTCYVLLLSVLVRPCLIRGVVDFEDP